MERIISASNSTATPHSTVPQYRNCFKSRTCALRRPCRLQHRHVAGVFPRAHASSEQSACNAVGSNISKDNANDPAPSRTTAPPPPGRSPMSPPANDSYDGSRGLNSSRRAWLLTATAGSVLAGAAAPQPPAVAASAAAETLVDNLVPITPLARPAVRLPPPTDGILAYRDPSIFRGLATDAAVRSERHLEGLIPHRKGGLQLEVDRALVAINRCTTPLQKYEAVMTLRETNRDAFYGLLSQNIEAFLPIIYTPTVGDACLKWSTLMKRPTGLYISAQDKGKVAQLVANWASSDVRIAVITDGERILGLGDIGANGMGISVGKASVYTATAGVKPSQVIPITLDVGCNSVTFRDDPLYIGLPQPRIDTAAYDGLVDELVAALRARWGPSLVLHWEDLDSKNSYRLLAKYRAQGFPTFNDDIESTAAAVVASMLGAVQMRNVPPLKKQHFLLFGAGQANIGSARLLLRALVGEGLSVAEARKRIWLYDSKGVVYEGRKDGKNTPEKAEFARSAGDMAGIPSGATLADVVAAVKPTALIGAAAAQKPFTREVIQALVAGAETRDGAGTRPVVLALSNPSSVSECTAQEAMDWSSGKVVFASGTAFPSIPRSDGSLYVPSQANNSLIFPGVGLGCIASGATQINEKMMLAAAQAVAAKLTRADLAQGSILPDIKRIRQVALGVAAAVSWAAETEKVSSPAANEGLSCLFRGDSEADISGLLVVAERCIATSRYDPFAAENAAKARKDKVKEKDEGKEVSKKSSGIPAMAL